MKFNSCPINKHVNNFCDPEFNITRDETISLIAKYLIIFLDPTKINKTLNISDAVNSRKIKSDNIFFKENRYQLSLLMDIPSTAIIFEDIANRKIKGDKENFLGLDMGTGTGILALAAYIAASRNGFKNITNIGFDKKESILDRANFMFLNIGFGRAVLQDTTNSNIKRHLPENININFFINENLPSMTSSLKTGNEPFIENLQNLFNNLPISDNLEIFPQKVHFEEGVGCLIDSYLPKEKFLEYKKYSIVNLDEYKEIVKKIDLNFKNKFRILPFQNSLNLSKIFIPYIETQNINGSFKKRLLSRYFSNGESEESVNELGQVEELHGITRW